MHHRFINFKIKFKTVKHCIANNANDTNSDFLSTTNSKRKQNEIVDSITKIQKQRHHRQTAYYHTQA